jgi:ribosomal protein L37E
MSLSKAAAEAKKNGLARFVGTKCVRCGSNERWSANSVCVACSYNKTKRYWMGKTVLKRREQIISGARSRAKVKGIEFSITVQDLEWPEICPVLGIQLNYFAKMTERPFSPSLDRLDPKQGYVKGNVFVISNRANTIKNDASVEDLQKVLAYITEHTMV